MLKNQDRASFTRPIPVYTCAHGLRGHIFYWFNPDDGTVFCYCEAPSKEAAEAVHRKAHGMLADEIIEVQERG